MTIEEALIFELIRKAGICAAARQTCYKGQYPRARPRYPNRALKSCCLKRSIAHISHSCFTTSKIMAAELELRVVALCLFVAAVTAARYVHDNMLCMLILV